jgi:ribosomal protein L10
MLKFNATEYMKKFQTAVKVVVVHLHSLTVTNIRKLGIN